MTQYRAPYLPRLRELAAAQNPFESSADYIRLCRYPKRATLLGVALHFIQDFIQSL